VVKDGEDISNTIFLNFTDAEFSMFMDSFRLPPATLDDDYEMSLTETGYLFYKNDYAVLISPDLKVSMLEADAYHAQYIWAGEALETIIVTMPYGIKMTFTLTDKWIAQ
jgi:hypothetical protein